MVKTAWLGVSNASKKNKEDNIHNIALVKLKNMVYVVAYNSFKTKNKYLGWEGKDIFLLEAHILFY